MKLGGHDEIFVNQLDEIIKDYNTMLASYQYEDLSDAPEFKVQALLTRSTSAIDRISGKDSSYSQQLLDVNIRNPRDGYRIGPTIGIIMALKFDIESGYLQTYEQIIHAGVFSDFIQMANYLLDKDYKDPAAVIAGSTLESHLRKLSKLHGIDLEFEKNGDLFPKKASILNSELTKAGVYNLLDQKSVTAWLDLRNKASHGKYDEYSREQVALFISNLLDFMVRNPA